MYKIIVLLIIVVIINLINGIPLTVVDVTIDRSGYHKYSRNGNGCNIEWFVMVEDPDNTFLSNYEFYTPEGAKKLYAFYKLYSPTYTKVLYQLSLESPGGFGPYDLTVTNGIVNTTISMNMSCIEPLKSEIQIVGLTEMQPSVFGFASSRFKITGLQYPLIDPSIAGTGAYNVLIGDSYFLFYLFRSGLLIEAQVGISFQLGATEGSFPILTNNYYKLDNVEFITDFTLYPGNGIEDIELMGNLYAPVYTWKSNSTYYAPSYKAKAGPFYNDIFVFRPISTEGSITKYIGFVDYRGLNGVLTQYGFYAQDNGDNTLRQQFSFNIKAEPFDQTQSVGTISQSDVLINIDFQSTPNPNYYYSPVFLMNKVTAISNFPFGYIYGSNKVNYTYSANHLSITYDINPWYCYVYKNFYNYMSSGFSEVLNSPMPMDPQLTQFKVGAHSITHLYDNIFVLRFHIEYYYPLYKFLVGFKVFGMETMVSGTEYNGVFELVLNSISNWPNVIVNDILYQNIPIGNNILYSFDYPAIVKPFSYVPNFDYNDIRNVTILYKKMNVTNQAAGNILYFNYTNIDINTPISFVVGGPKTFYAIGIAVPKITEDFYDRMFPAYWNSTIQMFQVEFWLPKNSESGKVPFALVFQFDRWVLSGDMGPKAQFTVISKNADLQGPIFSNIVKFPSSSVPVSSVVSFGWVLTIEDASGFRDGFVKVRGVEDGSEYNFPLIATISDYTIELSATSNCYSQDYVISDVTLYDIENNNSTFSITFEPNSLERSLYNPFINYMDDSNINRITLNCASSTPDPTPPSITSFTPSTQIINVGGSDAERTITFTMVATDTDSGVKPDHYPTIYLSTVNFVSIKCGPVSIVTIDANSNQYTYSITLPSGYGHPYGMILSVYGLVNNGGYYGGYNTEDLLAGGFQHRIETTYSLDAPEIKGSSRISTEGGELWITGKGLQNVVSAQYNYNSDNIALTIVTHVGSSGIKLSNIPPGETTFSIRVSTGTIESNVYFVSPFKRVEIIHQEDSSSSSLDSSASSSSSDSSTPSPTPTVLPTISPIPTNKPQKCLGTPECGGPTQGYCSSTGCICISPWIGISCSSKVIIVPPPVTNQTDPSTEIKIPPASPSTTSSSTTSGSSSSPSIEEIIYKSFISLISIRELNFNEDQVVWSKTFDKWIYTQINESKYQYMCNVTKTTSDGIVIDTPITVQLEWFTVETKITFANQQLTMNPSTLKYTIDIGTFQFESALNRLELVMSASLESSKQTDVCSSSELGDTSSDDSANYLKLSIEDHSMYGRFLKRGIVDGSVVSIGNRLLDDSYKLHQDTEYSTSSFIGISIPNFKSSVTIDPDFSVLVNSNSVSNDDENSICSNDNSGLTKPQLIGIIVGSAVIGCAIIGTVAFVLLRKSIRFRILVKQIKMKKYKS